MIPFLWAVSQNAAVQLLVGTVGCFVLVQRIIVAMAVPPEPARTLSHVRLVVAPYDWAVDGE